MSQIHEKLQEFKQITLNAFLSNLVGIYIHGSVAMNSFNSASSDVDILVVVRTRLTEEEKKNYSKQIVNFSEDLNLGKGLEMSVILEKNVKNFVYPTPYEFHFAYDKLEQYKAGFIDGGQNGSDPDLAAHFVITKTRGILLYGEPILNLFPDIPKKYYLQSIAQDAEWSFGNIARVSEEGSGKVPMYAVLNFCRVLAFIDRELITSKREGGEWGLENLPLLYHPVIEEALKEYFQSDSSKKVSLKTLRAFNIFAINKIRNALKKVDVQNAEVSNN